MTGSVYRRCEHGKGCADLKKKGHGSYVWAARLPTLEAAAAAELAASTGRRTPLEARELIRRGGFEHKRQAEDALKDVHELLSLAAGDDRARQQIGSLVRDKTMRGGQIPDKGLVARRLGLGADPGEPGVTFGQAWKAYLDGKRKLRPSSLRRLKQIGRHWLLPALADVALERLNGQHCAEVFARIDRVNAEVAAQKADGRAWIHADGDVRDVPTVIGTASMHRVYAALQGFLTHEVRKTRRLAFNPIYAVELEPEETPEAQRWSAAEAARFIAATAGDPLGLMFRIAVLRGARRGELAFRWSASDLDAGYLGVTRTILQLGGTITEGRPKSTAGVRKVWLDDATIRLLREHRRAQLAARLRAGGAWQDNDLIFCREDGSPWPPDYLSRRWKAMARDAGVPVIKLHEGRHSAASLQRDAAVDPEIRRRTLGHADQAMTSHYTHVEAQTYRQAANAVADHVGDAGPAGSAAQ